MPTKISYARRTELALILRTADPEEFDEIMSIIEAVAHAQRLLPPGLAAKIMTAQRDSFAARMGPEMADRCMEFTQLMMGTGADDAG
jgi:hypothetical protein